MESDSIVGSDGLVTTDQLADIIIKVSGKNISKRYDTSRPQGVRGRNSDNTLIKKTLRWVPSISLEEGIRQTYPWITQQMENRKKLNCK